VKTVVSSLSSKYRVVVDLLCQSGWRQLTDVDGHIERGSWLPAFRITLEFQLVSSVVDRSDRMVNDLDNFDRTTCQGWQGSLYRYLPEALFALLAMSLRDFVHLQLYHGESWPTCTSAWLVVTSCSCCVKFGKCTSNLHLPLFNVAS